MIHLLALIVSTPNTALSEWLTLLAIVVFLVAALLTVIPKALRYAPAVCILAFIVLAISRLVLAQ